MSRKTKKTKQKERDRDGTESNVELLGTTTTSVWWGARFEHASRPSVYNGHATLSVAARFGYLLLVVHLWHSSHLTPQQLLELISSFSFPLRLGSCSRIFYYPHSSSSADVTRFTFNIAWCKRSARIRMAHQWIRAYFHNCWFQNKKDVERRLTFEKVRLLYRSAKGGPEGDALSIQFCSRQGTTIKRVAILNGKKWEEKIKLSCQKCRNQIERHDCSYEWETHRDWSVLSFFLYRRGTNRFPCFSLIVYLYERVQYSTCQLISTCSRAKHKTDTILYNNAIHTRAWF